MSYSYIENRHDLGGVSELKNYYELNIIKIAQILNRRVEEIPKGIALYFEPGESAFYIRQDKRITYQYKSEDELLLDKGRIIHEAVHVVQDYPFELSHSLACRCWVEGIADYCRAKLDSDFQIGDGISHQPEKGYRDTAHFLMWLSENHPTVICDLNNLIRKNGSNLKNNNQIFFQLLQISYNDLKRRYIYDLHDNIG